MQNSGIADLVNMWFSRIKLPILILSFKKNYLYLLKTQLLTHTNTMRYLFSILALIAIFSTNILFAGKTKVEPRIEPPFWWVGMKNQNLQLLVHHPAIGQAKPSINYPGVSISNVHLAESPNYLFIDLKIDPSAKPGIFEIAFVSIDQKINFKVNYELKPRSVDSRNRDGFGPQDVIYMLMPDRFSNGDSANDNVASMLEKADRTNPNGRHGGDIQGIVNHTEYFKKLGVTAVWVNPLLENNMEKYSYHGYAITDFYKIDPRFGTNDDYQLLSRNMQSKGIKLIADMVFNHCGLNHWWMKDLPFADWVHQFPEFTRSNYRSETLMDPHASADDRRLMNDGWFDNSMPDLNQENIFMANYLIQNSIWWVEYGNLGGIRMDTYPYSSQDFMKNWMGRIYEEYPNFNVVGETWLQSVPHTSWFQNNAFNNRRPNTNLQSLTDFPMMNSLNMAFNENDSWTEGAARFYMVLSQDFAYENPEKLVIFADNHDVSRFFSTQNTNIDHWKMGMGILMTTRGIPVIYYGTEILMEGKKDEGDAALRKDFPGGWQNDEKSVKDMESLTENELMAWKYMNKLLIFRQSSEALKNGKLMHFIPMDGVYVYWRYSPNQKVIVFVNNNKETKTVKMNRFDEALNGSQSFHNIITGHSMQVPSELNLESKSVTIFELK